MRFLRLFPCLAVLTLTGLAAAPALPARPNIVFILSDDMGWNQLAINGGDPRLSPHITRLAQEGMRLTQFYTQSVCSPARTALLTGRYPFRTWMDWRTEDFGKEEFLARLNLSLPKTATGEPTRRVHGLDLHERTLAEALREAGYYTAIIGKWHQGEWLKAHLPLQRGFMHQYGPYAWGIDYNTKMIVHNAPSHFGVYDWHRDEQPVFEPGYATDLLADETERIINQQDGTRPFFLYVPFTAVHDPINQVPRYVEQYGAEGATLKILDDAVGRIIALLERKGFAKNTLVVFTNDNGGRVEDSNRPLRGKKDTNWEGGIRVPAIVWWPGVVAPGTVRDGLMHISDFYPTLVKVAGGSLDQPLPLDGMDMAPMLFGGQPSPRHEIVFEVTGTVRNPAIRQDDYKLVGHELFNVVTDPYETKNVAAEHPDIVARLKTRIRLLSAERQPIQGMESLMDPPLPYIYGEEENRNPPAWLVETVKAERAKQPQHWAEGETPWPKPPPPIPPLD